MIHNVIVEEFGERHSDPSLGAGFSEEEIEVHQSQEPTSNPGIELHEFPWAMGDTGSIGAAVPVASGELQIAYSYLSVTGRCRIWNYRGVTTFQMQD